MCLIEIFEGFNIGLIGLLLVYVWVNLFGFIEMLYCKVVDGVVSDEIVYLIVDEEDCYVVVQVNLLIDVDGCFVELCVLVCCKVGEVEYVFLFEVDYMDVLFCQMVLVVIVMIFFLEYDDVNCVFMGVNMQCQVVLLVCSEVLLVGIGMELCVVIDVGDVVVVDESGVIEEVLVDYIIVMYDNGIWCIYWMCKFVWFNYGICVNQCFIVDVGD